MNKQRSAHTQMNTRYSPTGPSISVDMGLQAQLLVTTQPKQDCPSGGETPLYKLYRVWFLSRFSPKTGIDFDHHGLKSGMVF